MNTDFNNEDHVQSDYYPAIIIRNDTNFKKYKNSLQKAKSVNKTQNEETQYGELRVNINQRGKSPNLRELRFQNP